MLISELALFILPACFDLHCEIRGNFKGLWYERAELLQICNPPCSAGQLFCFLALEIMYPFKTIHISRQPNRAKSCRGNYWAAVTGSNSFSPASVILGCWTKMFLSILPFLSCAILAVPTPSGLPLMQRVEPTKWSDEYAQSFFICGVFFVVFIYFLYCCSVASLAEWFSVWRSWINERMTASTKPPDL